ncbi:MAG TPA: HlyD family efflux transporter periplasmic adaptor subunit [Candidatus Polarisedimenticolia bacterium]|nr:HlyD family efflux transporter periplasmic adaptor subunit [Candidatus Polarisedimenticolia bacterium]
MDIARPDVTAQKRRRRLLYGAIGAAVIVIITAGLSRLEPAAPTVERSTVLIDTVKRGPMLRQVRGSGTLVPESIRWIPAVTEGRVERILVLPGTAVKADTILLELSNPELQVTAAETESAVRAGEAELKNLKVQLHSQLLNQQAQAAMVRSSYHQAKLQAEANAELAKSGLVAPLTLKLSQVTADELADRAEIEQKRLEISAEAAEAQVTVQQSRLEQLRATARLRHQQVEALKVRAGFDGQVQQVPVEVGQQIAPGANLARVAEPGRLKAEVRIAETQTRDIEMGLVASIDTRNGVIPGRVVRIDPASENGTVTVDIALEGPLPRGARPDLTVDGTIELERLDNVLHVGRPAFGQEKSTVGLFRLTADGREAYRAQIKLGRSSVNTVEILEGLNEGDQVVLSDMSAWDAFDRVRLN